MKIINTVDGATVQLGQKFLIEGATWGFKDKHSTDLVCLDPNEKLGTLLEVKDNFFSAKAKVRDADGDVHWTPLIIRFMHPEFMFQRVAFIPT